MVISYGMQDWEDPQVLLRKLKSFVFPGGETSARLIRRVRLTEKGEMRQSPDARWTPFTAEETIEARQSGFTWQARFRTGRVLPILVTDAYEDGHGRLVVKIGGALPVVHARGPEVDKGELQRCLADIVWCPPMLLSHPTLEWEAEGKAALRVADAKGIADASICFDIAEDGCPFQFRAKRPRTVGKKTVVTPWSGRAEKFFDCEGLRIPEHVEASWELPGGTFTYFCSDVTSFSVERD